MLHRKPPIAALIAILAQTLVLFLSLSCVQGQTNKTLIARPETGPFAGSTFYTNSHALVIGVSEYAFLPKKNWLNYAAKDAVDMRDVLIRSYGFLPENVTVLLNDQATKANILHTLATLADNNRVKKEDRVLIYFSGHGQTVKTAAGGDLGFLIPYDAKVDLSKPENSSEYLDTCVQMDDVRNYIAASPAKHSLLIADACFGGLLINNRALTSERPSTPLVIKSLSRPAHQAITAGGKDEEVQEDPKLGHGYFTYKLLEELNAQAGIPDTVFFASQLGTSLTTSVGNLTNGKQSPKSGNYDGSEGDFVFLTTAAKTVPPLTAIGAEPLIVANPERPTVEDGGGGGVPQVAKTKINPKDGAVMIFIPAGNFLMGDDDQKDNPRHTVRLSGYWIYKDLVTVGMYKQFCKETARQMPPEPQYPAAIPTSVKFNPGWSKEDHPIVNVLWDEAVAYCTWAGVALPSDAQWEKAARGTDGRTYPWGNTFDVSKVWASKLADGDSGGTTSVGRYGVSPYGCTDMAGNVAQWCADWWDLNFWSSRLAEATDPVNQRVGEQTYRVLRGGSWDEFGATFFRVSFRLKGIPTYWDTGVGFRCASGQ